MVDKDTKNILKAQEIAVEAHFGQMRKGSDKPYIIHPMNVALYTENMCRKAAPICAAYLHDVLEDTNVSEKEILKRMGKIGNEVLDLIHSDTEDKSLSWEERKNITIENIYKLSYEEACILLADKLDNISNIESDYYVANVAGKKVVNEGLWNRFNRGKEEQCWYYTSIYRALRDVEIYLAHKAFYIKESNFEAFENYLEEYCNKIINVFGLEMVERFW